MSGLMQGKRAYVTGVANDPSIAWAIARQFQAEGAELAFSYPGEAMGKRTIPLVKALRPAAVLDLDVSSDDQIDAAVREVGKVWDSVDVLVHAIGYAPREALDGRFTDVTTREAWRITMDVSVYFADHGGSQCGYCTSGMVMTAKALLDKEPAPSRERIKEALSGNLCRCTGYQQIWESVEAAAKELREGKR